MVSINTTNNGVAMAALRRINTDLATTQNRIATGYRVNSARDDATVWATAATFRSDAGAADTLKSNMSTAKAQADAGVAALDEISLLLQDVANIKVAAAQNSGGTPSSQQIEQVKQIAVQITALINSAALNGKNILGAAGASNNIAAKVTVSNGSGVGDMSFTALGMAADVDLKKVLDVTDASTFGTADAALAQTAVAKAAGSLGTFSKGLDSMIGFADKLADIRNNAIGGLVDADLERESAKLQALQVREQLAYQALSMSSNSAQNILLLFR